MVSIPIIDAAAVVVSRLPARLRSAAMPVPAYRVPAPSLLSSSRGLGDWDLPYESPCQPNRSLESGIDAITGAVLSAEQQSNILYNDGCAARFAPACRFNGSGVRK